ncbi:hypothetical protein [Plantactinospora sp. WMMB782]|uniref:hypothetical protein n=1 Tax=Plantactinospora sp. WMMB782 TaxID=3404121 RepID=UPI003B945097
MSGYQPVPLPTGAGATSRADLVAGLTGWARSRPLRDLVAAFGAELPDRLPPDGLLGWLDDFSARHWDFRSRHGAVERDEVGETVLDPAVAELVRSAASALGLAGPRPVPGRRYDHLLVLGGLARSCLQRTAYAARLLDTGVVEVGEVAALGSFRPLRPVELDRLRLPTDRPGTRLDGGYEVDAMDLGIRIAFGCPTSVRRRRSAGGIDHHSWSVAVYRPEPVRTGALPASRSVARPVVRVLAAPSTEPETRRAHTSDTYHFWAGELRPAAGDRVLVLTSQLYVPFQHFDALRTLALGYGCEVDTVGVDPDSVPGYGAVESSGPDRYLQEIRSAIRSIRNLLRVLG